MPKRKALVKEPQFWNKNGRYIVPYGHSTFKDLQNEYADISVIFIKHCNPMSICKEIFNPREFENQTCDYYIIDEEEMTPEICSKIKKFKINIRAKEVFWDGINFLHRDTIICDECFKIGILTPKRGCLNHVPKCGHNKNKLQSNTCNYCFARSFASFWQDVVSQIVLKEDNQAQNLLKGSGKKHDFSCRKCNHIFQAGLDMICFGRWCSFCANKRLCGKEDCKICFEKSFASFDEKKRNCIQTTENLLLIFKQSNLKYDFKCYDCAHLFPSPLNDIFYGNWCPYCSGKRLCGQENCKLCFERSFASFDLIKRNCIQTKENLLFVFKYSHDKYNFICFKCTHLFLSALYSVSHGYWCRYCQGCVCGNPDCLICDKQCEMGTCSHKARKQTRITRIWYCNEHFKDCIARNPEEMPLIYRAKISLEIYTLAELQRLCMNEDNCGFHWSTPTNWDCSMIPGLTYRPDNLFCFDKKFQLLYYADDLTLNLNQIGYVIIFEVLEEGRKQHSRARSISDEDREHNIRNLLDIYNIPLGFLYASMAHIKHLTAHPDDVFFHKLSNGEYEVISDRLIAFQTRIKEIRDALTYMFEKKLNSSKWIGH